MKILADGLLLRGWKVTVLTVAWDPHWPQRFEDNGIDVVRLSKPSNQWFRFRFKTALARWLLEHLAEFDLVCASELRHDAYVASHVLSQTSVPVVLRAENAGSLGDCQIHGRMRFGKRIRRWCKTADAVIATDRAIHEELIEARFPSEKIHFIRNGVLPVATGRAANRMDARLALADANADLVAGVETPVAAYLGRLHHDDALRKLVRAWSAVVRRLPNARLWLVGDGPFRQDLFREVRERELERHVFLPGTIDCPDELLAAIDVFVHPSREPGLSQAVLEAAAADRPVIAIDTAANRELQQALGERICLVSPYNIIAWSNALLRHLQAVPAEPRTADTSRAFVEQFSTRRMVRQHVELFESLIAASRHPD